MERLQKTIAASGLTSRRGAEDLITKGLVTVNGKRATIGMQVLPEDIILVQGKPLPEPQAITYVLNKPVGVVCSVVRQGTAPIITDLVPKKPSVYPVGRLDKESGGLILLTNDGRLAQQLTHPSFEHAKQYKVKTVWKPKVVEVSIEQLEKKLLKGVKLSDGKAKADDISIVALPEGGFHLTITLHEGRQHVVRRMCAVVGMKVTSLVRIRISNITLGSLSPGQYRVLSKQEELGLLKKL